jgi:hypothetical protein
MERDRARQCINRIIKGRNVSDAQCMATVGLTRLEFVDHIRTMLPADLPMESFGSKWRIAYVKRPFTQATDENLVAGYNWQNIKIKRKDGIPVVPQT